jgi:gliding motility-associated-like protein
VQDQVMISVLAEGSYYIPKMFTPDGDGINDILFVNTLGYKSVDFKLFNRFGQLVFSTDDTSVGWDGTFNRSIQNPDTYVYTLVLETLTNQVINDKGSLRLVR